MTNTSQTSQNNTVSVETLRDENDQLYLAVVYVNGHGASVVIGEGYANIDEAKSAAWALGQQLKATVLPTKGRART